MNDFFWFWNNTAFMKQMLTYFLKSMCKQLTFDSSGKYKAELVLSNMENNSFGPVLGFYDNLVLF